MVNCPKCQFNQPKDRFCANCGVDMDAYRPSQPPIAVMVAKNWMFQLSVFLLAVVIGVIVIRSKNRAQFSESFAALEQVTSKQRNFLSKKPVAKNLDLKPQVQPEPTAVALVAPTPAEVQIAAPVTALRETPLAATTDAASALPTKLKLIFAEVNRTALASLLGDSRNIASFGTYFSGLFPDRDDKAKAEFAGPGFQIIDTANDLQIKPNQPIVVFKGSRDPQIEQNLGVNTLITPTFVDEQGAHLQIEVKRTLRAPAGTGAPITEEVFQEQMILKKDARGFMSGLLPHRILSDDEARVLGNNPTILKVLASNDFQNSNSEFVLIIEAK